MAGKEFSQWAGYERFTLQGDAIESHSASENVKQAFCQIKDKHKPPTLDPQAADIKIIIRGGVSWPTQMLVGQHDSCRVQRPPKKLGKAA